MQFLGFRYIPGPNVYTHKPVVIGRLDLGPRANEDSASLPGFTAALIKMLPGLAGHHCGVGKPGGFLERLQEGTYLGHVVEHVAIELAHTCAAPVNHGKTRAAGRDGLYDVIVETCCGPAMRNVLETALELVTALLERKEFDLGGRIEELRRITAAAQPGPTTRAILSAAERRGIPYRKLDEQSLYQLGWGANRKLIAASITSNTSAIAVDIACDKELTKRLLREAWIPVARGGVANNLEEAICLLNDIESEVAVKPVDGQQGQGVTLHVRSEEQMQAAFEAAASPAGVLVEEMLQGNDYRVLVVNGQVAAVSRRTPPSVTGDGVTALDELIRRENQRETRGEDHEKPLTRITIDQALEKYLAAKEFTLASVPAKGVVVQLSDTANLSTGGEATDATGEICLDVRRVCERAARLIGLDVCGIDLIAPHIGQPLGRGSGIVEVNAAPGLRMHHYPSSGQSRDAGEAIIQTLFPGGRTGRIPLIAITGTNGKTTVTRMIAHVLSYHGWTVGMTTTDGIYIDNQCIARGDMTGPQSASAVLSDPQVECAVLETARGGIVRRGLAFDWCDAAVMTNIQTDHFGQDGIESVEDLLWIKSLVAERVREGGAIVLNADDPLLANLPASPKVNARNKRVVFFSLDSRSPVVDAHLRRGGSAFYVEDGWIVEADRQSRQWIARISDMAITLGGAAEFQVMNVLAATAACRSIGLPRQVISSALRTFCSGRHNSGRANLFRFGESWVMVDYGHNPGAFSAVCRMARQWKGTGVAGVVGVPGDRSDALIESAGRQAALGFDRIIIKEDSDLRGRASGETAGLLHRSVLAANPGMSCVIILDELEAVRAGLDSLEPGELLIVFYEKLNLVLDLLRSRGAVAVAGFDPLPGSGPVLLWSGSAGERPEPALET